MTKKEALSVWLDYLKLTRLLKHAIVTQLLLFWFARIIIYKKLIDERLKR